MSLKPFPNSSKGGVAILIILAVVFIGALAMTGSLLPTQRKPNTTTAADVVNINGNTNPGLQQGLQLKAVGPMSTPPPQNQVPTIPPTNTPIPTSPIALTPVPTLNFCNYDNGKPVDDRNCYCPEMMLVCKDKKCVEAISYKNHKFPPGNNCIVDAPELGNPTKADWDGWCNQPLTPTDGTFCIGKPVIYLYPTKKTLVDVTVETSGQIVVSDPLYPIGGWKNVTAYPDGTLNFENKNYRELFYESSVNDIKKPDDGLIVKTENIEQTLRDLTDKLGLIPYEQKELVDFWTPRLKGLNSKYIFVSLISKEEKDRTDRVLINPKPDTMIDFILYFKSLDKTININPLILPTTPKRIGFTAVEWGGTIEY